MDLQEVKQKLLTVLKGTFETYWDTLRKFIRSKISKPELDGYVRTNLASEENISLHNQLVLSILKNAHKVYTSKVPPRAHPPGKEHKHGKSKEKEKLKIKDRKEAVTIKGEPDENQELSETTVHVKRKHHLISPPPSRSKPRPTVAPGLTPANLARFKRYRDANGLIRPIVTRPKLPQPLVAQPSRQPAPSPDLQPLRQRMVKLVQEAGLADVSNDSVQLMMFALENHLKDIIGHADSTRGRNDAPLLTSVDLYRTIRSAPHLFGGELPMNQERLGFALYRAPELLRDPTRM